MKKPAFFIGKPCKRGHTERFVASRECVVCVRAKATAWARAHPEKHKAWMAANADRKRASDAAWRKANPEKRRAGRARYYAAHPEKEKGRVAAWRKKNPTKVRAWYRAWLLANPGKARAATAAWARNNSEKVRALNLAWRRQNPEKKRALIAAWRRANPLSYVVYASRRRAWVRKALGRGVKPPDWKAALKESLGICAYCNERRPLTMDHVEPLARGGEHDVENITAACKSCNCSKNDTPLLLWLANLALRKVA